MDKQLNCPNCQKPYDNEDRAPIILSCKHRMCYYCILNQYNPNRQNVYKCATCNKSLYENITSLTKDIQLLQKLEEQKREKADNLQQLRDQINLTKSISKKIYQIKEKIINHFMMQLNNKIFQYFKENLNNANMSVSNMERIKQQYQNQLNSTYLNNSLQNEIQNNKNLLKHLQENLSQLNNQVPNIFQQINDLNIQTATNQIHIQQQSTQTYINNLAYEEEKVINKNQQLINISGELEQQEQQQQTQQQQQIQQQIKENQNQLDEQQNLLSPNIQQQNIDYDQNTTENNNRIHSENENILQPEQRQGNFMRMIFGYIYWNWIIITCCTCWIIICWI